jgi:PRC-barrel domain
MKSLMRGPFTLAVTLAAVGGLTLLPSAAQRASRKALAEDSAPVQAVPMPPTGESPVETRKLGSVLGIEVRSSAEQNVGRIVDLLASRSGQVEAAVVEFGGFLGMGSRKIAIEWSALRLETHGKQTVAILDMTRDQLRAAPEYKPERPIVVRRAVPSAPPAETAPPPTSGPAPPPEQSASPPPPSKKAASVKRKRRYHKRDQDW